MDSCSIGLAKTLTALLGASFSRWVLEGHGPLLVLVPGMVFKSLDLTLGGLQLGSLEVEAALVLPMPSFTFQLGCLMAPGLALAGLLVVVLLAYCYCYSILLVGHWPDNGLLSTGHVTWPWLVDGM